jgi:hypothetical protein
VQFAPQRRHAVAQVAEGVEHGLSGRVEQQAAADAVEQRFAERLFEFVQHLAGRRLGHAQVLRSGVQGAELVDGQQQGDLAHAQAIEQLFGTGIRCRHDR